MLHTLEGVCFYVFSAAEIPERVAFCGIFAPIFSLTRAKNKTEHGGKTLNIKDYGYFYETDQAENGAVPARVTAVHKGRYGIVSEHGEGTAQLKGKEYYFEGETFPTVGDFVLIDYVKNGESRIVKTLGRKTFFSRRDPYKGEQAVAANVDFVFIMQSLNRDFNPNRMERYLVAARQSGAEPVIILTKADLTDDYLPYIIETSRAAEDVKCHIVSARTGYGMEELSPYLEKGKTLVFLGSSGVGKSSLVNALAGEEIMDTNGIREDDGKGRHTTTHRELVMLKCGAMIIDTPGMRELGMWDVTEGLGDTFSDVEAILSRRCKFRDCRHRGEPGCAVRAAIDSGELDEGRWERYVSLKAEAKYSDPAERRKQKEQLFKSIALYEKNKKKEIY